MSKPGDFEGVCADCMAMRCLVHQSVQYSHKVDAVIYGANVTRDFTREDWTRLALAALDQANVSPETLARAFLHARGDTDRTIEEIAT